MTTAARAVGFIGLGAMGGPLARRLLGEGWRVWVHDRSAQHAQSLASDGAVICQDSRQVADSAEIVLVSLPSPEIVLTVASELLHGQACKLFVDLSTTGPATAEEVGEMMAGAGIQCVDCPVSGGPSGARAGRLTLMASGAPGAIAAARPVLDVFGATLVVGDRPGQGQTAKVINNLLSASAIATTAEALALGVKAGLDLATLLSVINASSGASNASQTKFPLQVLTRQFDHGFRLSLMVKDVRLCLDEAHRQDIPMLLGAVVGQLWDLAGLASPPDADCTEMVRLIEGWSGVTIEGTVGP